MPKAIEAINTKSKDEHMPANEFGKLRLFLAKKGVKQAEIKAGIGDVTGPRAEVADKLRTWLKTRPKKE